MQDADEIDDRVSALDRALNRRAMADIRLEQLDLADRAHRAQELRVMRTTDSGSDTPAALGELTDDIAPDKAGPAENHRQFARHLILNSAKNRAERLSEFSRRDNQGANFAAPNRGL